MSKLQTSGANTLLAHGGHVGGDELPRGSRWGVGGALAQKFAAEGHVVVSTTRRRENAAELVEALSEDGAETVVIEMEWGSEASVEAVFGEIRDGVGVPDVVVFNSCVDQDQKSRPSSPQRCRTIAAA
ncbi:SDR family NAD(P)-dependent oxidoreductase [Rhodococcus opacus]|nr:SDR family NAD(P)-dependent oxidoreductase [Rhodococcus opacus]WKN61375.1 SDR family NAD(P)-dependent oxidoreductase [Rhodococcus opacus]